MASGNALVAPAGMLGPSQGLTGPMTATGQTGPSPTVTPQPAKSSFFDSFLDTLVNKNIKPLASAIGGAFGMQAPTPQAQQEEEMQQRVRDRLASLQSGVQLATPLGSGRDNIVNDAANKISHVSSDILLNVAKIANDYVIKPLITTPLSTAGIITDPNSPLYKDAQFGKGFQPSDFAKAVDRANKVSPGQAIASNSLFQQTPPGIIAQGLSDAFHGPDFSKVNVFSDKSIKENYTNNTFGKIFTGSLDIGVQFPAFGALGKVADVASNVFRQAAGMAAKDAPLADVLKIAQANGKDGIDHILSSGTMGRPTNFGKDLVKMAQETSPGKVVDTLRPYTNNLQLNDFVAKETDPNKILDMILASDGDIAAQERVYAHSKDAAWAAMGGKDAVVSKIFLSDGSWLPQGDTLKTIHDVHIDAIKQVPEHEQFWNMFHDEKLDKQQIWGTAYFPAEGPVARAAYNTSGWVERQIGGHNNVVTRLISLSGSRMPNWFISFSNTTPYQALSEIESSFKSVPLFRNPDQIIQTHTGPITARQYIDNVKSNYLQAPNDIERYNVLNNIGENIGVHMAMTGGFYKAGETEQIIKDLQARMRKGDTPIIQDGAGMSLQGDMIEVDKKTQAQLANSIRLLPWDRIWKELKYHQGNLAQRGILKTEDFLHDAFKTMGGYISLDVLGKPGYIWKQSLGEPTIGAAIALGPRYLTENLPSGVSNLFTNNANRIGDFITKTGQYTSGERKAIVNKVAELGKQLDDALYAHNLLQEEHDAFFIKKTKTGKTVDIYGPEVKQAYKDSAKVVRALEDEYLAATRQWGAVPEIPSKASIERRLDYLASVVEGGSHQVGTDLLRIRNEMNLIKEKTKTISYGIFDSEGEVAAKDAAIAESYNKIDSILAQLSDAQKERAGILGKTLVRKERLSGRKDSYRMIGGQWTRMPEVFDANAVGEALKGEVGNAPTTAMTYGNEYVAQTRAGVLRRHTPATITDVSDPHYYNELATLMNRFYRQDPLVRQILAGKSTEELLQWGESNLGQRYMSKFEFSEPTTTVSHIYDMIARVNRYLPSRDIQALLLKKEVLAPELETGLHSFVKELVPIHPRDFNYGELNSGLGNKYSSSISNVVNRFSNNVFTALMKPENPLRYSFIRTKAMDISAQKASYLVAQGKKLTFADLEALRQSSFVQAADEMRNVFYTVPQPNRFIYSTRLVTMFPTATFNAFYRYSRMAVKYPVRVLGFLHAYNSLFSTYGLDKNGNPVTDVRDAQYLALPMTKELGMFKGQGIRIPTRSVGFILNSPSLSPYATVPVSALVQNMPSADAVLKRLLGSNYDILFPYGTTATDVKTVMTPAWMRDGLAWTRSPMAKAQYLNSVKSLYDYHQVKISMGLEKTMPTLAQIHKEADGLFQLKAWYEFFAPTPVKIDTTPMSMFQQLYYNLETYYKSQGNDAVKSADLAGKDFLATVGPKFPLDQITFTGSNAKANIAKTQEGYARVYKDNVDLTKQLVNIRPDNPFVVSLLTMDMDVTTANRSTAVAQKLGQQDATLPGEHGPVALNNPALNPEEIQVQRQNQRTWDQFFAMKANLDTIAKEYKGRNGLPYKSMDSIPALRTALSQWAENTLGKQNPDWLNQEYDQKANMDKAFVYAKAMNLIVNNKKFMGANGSVPFWKDVAEFNKLRTIFVNLVETAPTAKEATYFKQAYIANLFGDETTNPSTPSQISKYDPKLQRLITMYFSKDNLTKVGD